MAMLCFVTAELFVTGGFRDPNFRKKKIEKNYKRVKGPYFAVPPQTYDSIWLVTTDFCTINLFEGEANETPRDIFIYDPFHEVPYREL